MKAIRLAFVVTTMAAMACSAFGGGAKEEATTERPVKEATSTNTAAGAQKEPMPGIATQVKGVSTSPPEETGTPQPTTTEEEPGGKSIYVSSAGIEYEELFIPVGYFVEKKADIKLVDFRVFRCQYGGDYLYGLIENTGSVPWVSLTVKIAALDKSGEVIGVIYGNTSMGTIYPGEVIPISGLWGVGIPEGTEEIVVGIGCFTDSDFYRKTHNYRTLSSEVKRLSDGRHMVSVRLRNDNEYATKHVRVAIAFFDSDDRIIGASIGFMEDNKTPILPGAEIEINFAVPTIIGDYARFEVFIEGVKATGE